jgi:hypothetical protein
MSLRRRLHLTPQGMCLGLWLPKGYQVGEVDPKAIDFYALWGSRSKRTKNNAPLVNSQTVEENEGLRPRLSWVEATDIFHVYCRILPGIWVFFHAFSRWLCLLKTSLVIIH